MRRCSSVSCLVAPDLGSDLGRRARRAAVRAILPASYAVVAGLSLCGWLAMAHSPGVAVAGVLLGGLLGGSAAALWDEGTTEHVRLPLVLHGAAHGIAGLAALVGGWVVGGGAGVLLAGLAFGRLVLAEPPRAPLHPRLSAAQVRQIVSALPVERVLAVWGSTGSDDPRLPHADRCELAMIRGILLDELESRDPDAFRHWMQAGAPTNASAFGG